MTAHYASINITPLIIRKIFKRKGIVSDGECLSRPPPHGIILSTDFRAFMNRLSRVHILIFVRSPDFCYISFKLSCVHQTFVRSTNFRAFVCRLLCNHQTFERSISDFSAFTKILRVHQSFVRYCSDFRAIIRLSCVPRTFLRSCSDLRAFITLSCIHKTLCVHVQTSARSGSVFHAFQVKQIVITHNLYD